MDSQTNNIFDQYAELVRRYKTGDESAFTEIYTRSKQMVYVTCFGILNNEQDAEDAMQETYITAYSKIDTLSDENAFIHWLKTIAANKARDKFKTRKNLSSIDDIIPDETDIEGDDNLENLPDALVLEKDKRDTFYRIMRSELSDDQFQTILLYYYDELPVSDIAKIMDCPDNTIKTKLRLARVKIKNGIEAFEKTNKISLMGGAAGAQTLGNFFKSFYGQTGVPALKGLPFSTGLGTVGTSGTEVELAAKTASDAGAKAGSKAAVKAATGKGAKTAATRTTGKILAIIGSSVLGAALLGGGTYAVIQTVAKKEPEEIDLSDYFSYEFSGYDGDGIVTYTIDYESILEDYDRLDELRVSKLEKNISGEWDRSSELSNGETIVFKWDTDLEDVEEEYNVIFVCENIEAVVNDLEELPEIDPFESFNISFSGISSEGYVDNFTWSTSTAIGEVYYALSSDHGLSNGDVITVTASGWLTDIDDMAKDAHYMISRKTIEVTVEGLDEYVKSSSEITDKFVTQIQSRAFDVYKSDHTWYRYHSLEVEGTYFLSSNGKTDHKNIYFVVLKATRELSYPDAEVEQYYYVCFYDLIRHYDGTMYDAEQFGYERSYGTELYYIEPYGATFEAEGHVIMGYPDLDSLYADAIEPLLTNYTCESA